MSQVNLKHIPTHRELNEAYHQGEGLIIETAAGKKYSFVPKGHYEGPVPGICHEMDGDTFTGDKSEATLSFQNLDTDNPSALLEFH